MNKFSSAKNIVANETDVEQTPRKTNKPRLPLTRVFSTALATTLILFVVVTLLAFYRLLDFRTILSDLTEKSVPAMALSGQIYSQVNTLTYLTEGLTKSASDAARRTQFHQINSQLDELQLLAKLDNVDPYLITQLAALQQELQELNQLVEIKLRSEHALRDQLDSLYLLYERMQFSLNRVQSAGGRGVPGGWPLIFADVVALAGKMANLNRLHEIRYLDEQISFKLSQLDSQTGSIAVQHQASLREFTRSLQEIVSGEDGLIERQVELLRITGRATGRGNFVRNLILDYASQAEYQSYSLNEQVIENTKRTSKQVNDQIRIIGVASALAIAVIIAVVYFIQTRIVVRLNHLNSRVQQRMAGNKTNVRVGGNDEISDIAQSFEAFAQTIEEQNKILHNLSLSDGLTGIANRRALDQQLTLEVKVARRHTWPVSVLLIDVDFFKTYNDQYGHAKGDDCLKHIAKLLDDHMKRSGDFVARYGGEEFACVLPDTDEEGAQWVAREIQAAIAAQRIPHEFSLVANHITASIGITTYRHPVGGEEISPQNLLNQADKALYSAKEAGRNQFKVYSQADKFT